MFTKRPCGRRPPNAAAICFAELVVERITSAPPAACSAAPGSSPANNTSSAPNPISSALLSACPVTANVSSPTALLSCRAMCPRPPIPRTATRSPGLGSPLRRPLITVYPPQNSGAATSYESPSGISAQPDAQASINSEFAPPRCIQLCAFGQRSGRPAWQTAQRPSPFWFQNTPTRSPTFRSSTPAPSSTISPAGSCPSTIGVFAPKCPWCACRSVPHMPLA